MLYKNAFKLLKKKKFQLLAIGIIIFLSSFIYVAMYNAMNTIEDTLDKYIKETNQEDFVVNINDYAFQSFEALTEINLPNIFIINAPFRPSKIYTITNMYNKPMLFHIFYTPLHKKRLKFVN